ANAGKSCGFVSWLVNSDLNDNSDSTDDDDIDESGLKIQACSSLRKGTIYPGAALSYLARDVTQRQKNSLRKTETLITVIHPRALQDRHGSSRIIMAQDFHLSLRTLTATLLFLDGYMRVSSQRLKEEPALTSQQQLVRGAQTKLRNMDHALITLLQTST
ncbi:hypothetical protein M9458_020027, partial [Cirrhinus mrigala]